MKKSFNKIKALRLWFIFIAIGMSYMIISHVIGCDHRPIIFNHWYQYAIEGLLYSFCCAGIYHMHTK